MEKQNTSSRVLFSGAFLLTFSTLLVKLLGWIYKIPMLSILGTEGMGYFHSAYEFYLLFCTVATSGLPVAVSVLIADAVGRSDREKAEAIFRTANSLFRTVGIVGGIFLLVFSNLFCKSIKSPLAAPSVCSMAPTLLFSCLSASYRGYFQGNSQMAPTAISQLLETVGKLIFGVLFAWISARCGATSEISSAWVGIGLSLGRFVSFLYLYLRKRREDRLLFVPNVSPDASHIRRQLTKLALPITLGVSVTGATRILDLSLILRRLQSVGYSSTEANQIYGSYTTLALSVFGLLPSLCNAVTLPLIPLLSSAVAKKEEAEEGRLIGVGLRLISYFAIPGALGITLYAGEILSLLFAGNPEAVEVASPLLSYLGISVFFSCMIGGIQSVLHAEKQVYVPVLILTVGAILKSVAGYFLIGNPRFGIFGAPISSFLCNLTVAVGCMAKIKNERIPVSEFRAFFLQAASAAVSLEISRRIIPISFPSFDRNLLFFAKLMLSAFLYFLLTFRIEWRMWDENMGVLPKKSKKSSKNLQNPQYF